ncbi:MAG: hypothetical protein N3B18_07195 [Desulfobacterota bacterium]|nr:hypothetical protein [Thermodesulfobacteriota bacterium]
MFRLLRALINPAGGLRYHLRAMLYSPVLWRGFRKNIGAWLERWNPPEHRLIIIGQSGGYILNKTFLSRFQHIIAVDPDLLAALIFAARFRRTCQHITIVTEDFFITPEYSVAPLQDFLAKYGAAAVLLSNFLGQIPFLITDDERRRQLILFWHTHLVHLLAGRNWASFHDRYSSNQRPTQWRTLQTECRCSAETLIRYFYGKNAGGTFIDHETEGYFPNILFYEYSVWQLTPRNYHLIEAVYGEKSGQRTQ